MLDEAVNEFIESQKLRDRKLYKKFNESDEPPELIPILKKTKEAAKADEEKETEQDK